MKILTAINVASELDRIAMRGARYGFELGQTIEETKRGTKRRYLGYRHHTEAKAVKYLRRPRPPARSPAAPSLLMMAAYAKDNAVGNSNRAFHTVTIQTTLPWAGDVKPPSTNSLRTQRPCHQGGVDSASVRERALSTHGVAASDHPWSYRRTSASTKCLIRRLSKRGSRSIRCHAVIAMPVWTSLFGATTTTSGRRRANPSSRLRKIAGAPTGYWMSTLPCSSRWT
ncbi:MAG TPA: hypothetical protein VGO80_21630 [Solirubrobacteraceae bacterium]|nr:hypothetical protein [Solirubrobacteraceae bacterium]